MMRMPGGWPDAMSGAAHSDFDRAKRQGTAQLLWPNEMAANACGERDRAEVGSLVALGRGRSPPAAGGVGASLEWSALVKRKANARRPVVTPPQGLAVR